MPAGTDPSLRRGLPARRAEFRRAEAIGPRRRRRGEPVPVSASDGRARTDGRGRLLLARRVRPRRHQEARADASRQGRRSYPAHAGGRRADRPGVSDLPCPSRRSIGSWRRPSRPSRSSTSRQPMRCATRSGASTTAIATPWSRPRSGFPRCTSPTAIIGRRAPRVRAPSCGSGAWQPWRKRQVRRERRQVPMAPRSWRWRSRTTRSRSCPTTGSSRTSAGCRLARSWRRCAGGSSSTPDRPRRRARVSSRCIYRARGTRCGRTRLATTPTRSPRSMSACCRTSCWRPC